jgi:hypothetical protein
MTALLRKSTQNSGNYSATVINTLYFAIRKARRKDVHVSRGVNISIHMVSNVHNCPVSKRYANR